MRTFARPEVTAVHETVKGKALGIRVKGKRGTEELDVYLVSANAPVVQPGDADTVGAAHHTFWQSFERGSRRVPRRSVLMIGIDANGEVGSSLPWVGTGGERCPGTPYVGRWNRKWKRALHLGQRLWLETAAYLRAPPR